MHNPTTKPDTCPVATPGCACLPPGRRIHHQGILVYMVMAQIFAVISPRHICARPGRRCPHFVLNWRYTEVFKILLHHKNSIHIDFLQPELFSQGREIF